MKLRILFFFAIYTGLILIPAVKQHRTTSPSIIEHTSWKPITYFPKVTLENVLEGCCMYITAVAFEPAQPIYHWSNTSPTVSKDGMKMGILKGVFLSLFLPASSYFYPDLFELFPLSLRGGRYGQGNLALFPFPNTKMFCLGSFQYQICLLHVQTPIAIEPTQKTDLVNFIHDKWCFLSYTHWSQLDLRQSMQILILNPFPPPTDFTLFRNGGHCFNSSKTRCCRCPLLTDAILLMLCSTRCPVLLCFKR